MAFTLPTLPRSTPDIRVSTTVVRRVPTSGALADSAAFTTALANANYGDTIVLHAGQTYEGNFLLKATPGGTLDNGLFQNYVTITTDAAASLPVAGTRVSAADLVNMPTIVSPVASGAGGGSAALSSQNGANHYRFVGIHFTCPPVIGYGGPVAISPVNSADYATQANYPRYISFERCYLDTDFDYGAQKGYSLCALHAQIIDSVATNIFQLNNTDANAMVLNYGIGPYLLRNNTIEGMGENVFFGGACSPGVVVVYGTEWEVPNDVTIINNYIHRKPEWKRGSANYIAPCGWPAPGGSTFTSSGATITFSSAPGLAVPALPNTLFIKDVVTGQYRRLTALSGTTGTLASAFSPDVTSGHAWRYNGRPGDGVVADIGAKNLLETKACRYVLIDSNVFENGWSDGQQHAIVLNGRENGSCEDITFTNNKLIAGQGIALTVNDPNTGAGFGISPRPMKRVLVENNLWIDTCSTASQSLAPQAIAINMETDTGAPNGFFYGYQSTKIRAAAQTGSDVIFTASTPQVTGTATSGGTTTKLVDSSKSLPDYGSYTIWITVGGGGGPAAGESSVVTSSGGTTINFSPPLSAAPVSGVTQYSVEKPTNLFVDPWADPTLGNLIRYKTGVGRIISVGAGAGNSSSTCHVNISTTFPLECVTLPQLCYPNWSMGPASLLDLEPAADSWIFRHNTWVNPSAGGYATMGLLHEKNAVSQVRLPNFVFTKNIALYSANPGSSYGFQGQASADFGTVSLNDFTDSTRIFQKNVFYGTGVITTGIGAKLTNANGDGTGTTGAGSAFNTAFHEPDYNGITAGGAIGFTDWVGGDYTLNSSSPYRAAVNWTGDNTDAGYIPGTLATRWANVVAGTSTPVTPVVDPGNLIIVKTRRA